MNTKKFFATLCMAAIGVIGFSLAAQAKELSGPAPQFTAKTLDGKSVSLRELKGKVVMINFWASWCGPCRQEMPLLEEIYNDYKKAGFILLGVNLDEEVDDAKGFLSGVNVSFPVPLDPMGKVAEAYENQAMPSSYFVDKNGQLAYLHKGYRPGEEEDYRKVIKKLLAQ